MRFAGRPSSHGEVTSGRKRGGPSGRGVHQNLHSGRREGDVPLPITVQIAEGHADDPVGSDVGRQDAGQITGAEVSATTVQQYTDPRAREDDVGLAILVQVGAPVGVQISGDDDRPPKPTVIDDAKVPSPLSMRTRSR